jgi:hypothetical protein
LTVFLVSSVAASPVQQKAPQYFTISPVFTTPRAAVDYANTLFKESEGARFSFEFSSTSVPAVYRVIVDQRSAVSAVHWEQRPGFANAKDAINFANKDKVRAVAQFVSCWNSLQNPVSTSVTVFYIPSALPETSRYKAIDRTFAFPEEAIEFINNNLKLSTDLRSVQFLSEMNVANQMASVWRVVYLADSSRKSSKGNQLKWRARYYPTLDDALTEVSVSSKVVNYRIASSFDTWSARSKFVLFILQAP